jgi:RND family efflux transporter MFP subunit
MGQAFCNSTDVAPSQFADRMEPDRKHFSDYSERSVLGVVGRLFVRFVVLCPFFVLGGCTQKPPAPPAPPPSPVTVATPLQHEVIEWDTYNGYLEATESVTVSARVSGMIVAAPFTEGSLVKKNQVLFVLDDRPFKADLDLKVADHDKAKAQAALALLNLNRLEEAHRRNSVSQQEYDTAKADYARAQAAVDGAKASVELSRLNLEWCQVTSPIDGRVGKKVVTVGNLVSGAGPIPATLLTTIQSVSPIYCNFDVDERSVLKYQKLAQEKKRTHEREGKVPCYAKLGNETDYVHAGYVDFVDNRLDAATGTLRARGLLQNASGLLTPGFYASLRIPGSGRYKALLVPDTAVGNDQSHRTVLLINKENVVEVRPVQIGALFGDLRAIASGLSPGDRVIVNGQMHAFPGTTVAPTEVALKADPSSFAEPGATASDKANSISPVQPTAEATTGKTP